MPKSTNTSPPNPGHISRPLVEDRASPRPNVLPAELRQRAIRMVAEGRPNYESEWAAIGAVAQKLGIGTAETLRKWVRQAEVNSGARAGVTSEEAAEIARLRREVAELRRADG